MDRRRRTVYQMTLVQPTVTFFVHFQRLTCRKCHSSSKMTVVLPWPKKPVILCVWLLVLVDGVSYCLSCWVWFHYWIGKFWFEVSCNKTTLNIPLTNTKGCHSGMVTYNNAKFEKHCKSSAAFFSPQGKLCRFQRQLLSVLSDSLRRRVSSWWNDLWNT